MYVFAMILAALTSPCSTPIGHAFDFFVGTWNVATRSGRVVGHDVVRKELGGCELSESWSDVGDNGRGFGIFAIENDSKTWKHLYGDDGGLSLALAGHATPSGGMRFIGSDAQRGKIRMHRVVFTRLADHRVEEVWTMSLDAGKTWRPVFDGIFTPA